MSIIDTSANLNRWRTRPLAEKALLAIGMLLIAVAVPSWEGALLVAVVMAGVTLLGARIAPAVWWQALAAPLGFLLIGSLTLAFQVSDWHVSLAPHGLELSLRLMARAFAATLCLLFLALTTPATDLVAGLRRLGVPAEIAEMALLMYRFLFLLVDTAHAMNVAQAARLCHITRRRRMHSLGLLVANLMPRALARAAALEVGLAARGWHGELRVQRDTRAASRAAIAAIVLLEGVVLCIALRTR
ncbi:MAG TPA: cobalt ECF transporter T component CbiQ [Steroidobacteraceae bacterium]|nr:cobalt ECF transporter T component CbiQ [Steroidobacteraceae bacterium]